MKSRKSIQAAEFSEFLKNEPSIEAVLAHDKTVEEVCCCNPELSNYITASRLRQIIHYIIDEPDDPNDSVKSCKFPLIASEFFTADLPVVSKMLFNDPDLMRFLFSFVSRKPLNYLLAGYFLKAYESCLAFDSDKFMSILFSNNYHILLLGHIRSTSISEILLSILQQKGFFDERISLVEGICRVLLSPDALISANAAGILLKITKDDEIFTCFSSEAIITCLLQGLLSDSQCVIKNSGLVIKNLLLISPQNIIPQIKPHILPLSDIICVVPKTGIMTQFGVNIAPFGEHRVILLDIFAILCSFNVPELSICLPNILALLPIYEWSTYFHNSYTGLIDSIINNKSNELIQILIDTNFPNMLIELVEKSYVLTPKGLIPKGSIGHLYKLINVLVNSNLLAIEENLKFLEKWKEFEGQLGKYNEIEAKYIGGKVNINFFDNMSSDSTDKADEIDLIPDYPYTKPITGKELEELTDMFDMEEKNSQNSPFMATKVVKTATLEELKANEYLDNFYWKIELKVDNLEELD